METGPAEPRLQIVRIKDIVESSINHDYAVLTLVLNKQVPAVLGYATFSLPERPNREYSIRPPDWVAGQLTDCFTITFSKNTKALEEALPLPVVLYLRITTRFD